MKTTEVPAIIDEAKAAGCENADQINSYLAGEVSRLRGKNAEQEEILSDLCDYFDDDETNSGWELYEKTRACLGRTI